jgi:alpha-glucuronidase
MFSPFRRRLAGIRSALGCFSLLFVAAAALPAEDGYRLWLRYDRIADDSFRQTYAAALTEIVIPDSLANAVSRHSRAGAIEAARDELVAGLHGLLGTDLPVTTAPSRAGSVVFSYPGQPEIDALVNDRDTRAIGEEGYVLRRGELHGRRCLVIVANREIGFLYGAFALLRQIQTHQPIDRLDLVDAPKIQRRLLNHWDNLNRTVERGYAGSSLWDWYHLPDYADPRYRDYARACSSVGINGTVLNNVNADAVILTPDWLKKVAVLANTFRPYGVRVYLTARFSAPVEIGGLTTADPLDPAVKKWWADKANEIYALIPDFGGFLVKANSEGQPGPQTYGRTHADGANLLADALAAQGGIGIWRAFVYGSHAPDRAAQAYDEFKPLDGQFRDNVVVQVKNGPIDFMPREPFSPLFGAMPRTPLALELQITQEYLGGSTQLAFLAPLWKECLDADTFRPSRGSMVARVVDGSVDHHRISVIAGVANTGTDRNWTGHPLAQANWYAFGRLAWDHDLSSAAIADEWIRQTFSNDPAVVAPIASMLLESREAVVNYSMPLGLHHIMADNHHQGPAPWSHSAPRPDWTPVYYHRADEKGIGFDRTATGSNSVAQYAPDVAKKFSDLATCPENLLLWFHHVPWDYQLSSGHTLWDELCLHYQAGVDTVRSWEKTWAALAPRIDEERHAHVAALLRRQEREARDWRDACIQYFQTFSKRPLPAGVKPPEHPLDYYIDRPPPL